jgi:mercuric ion transport protein
MLLQVAWNRRSSILGPSFSYVEFMLAEQTNGRGALAAGGLAAVLASACCLGPLVLVSIGLGGAWVSSLQALEPFRPIFIGVAVVALFFAYRRIFRPVAECKLGEVCALPETRRAHKVVFWSVALLVLLAVTFPYYIPLFY